MTKLSLGFEYFEQFVELLCDMMKTISKKKRNWVILKKNGYKSLEQKTALRVNYWSKL